MAGVFISYRRQDSAGWAGRLHDHLAARLGPGQVFMDVATLRPGEDYTASITRTLDTCTTMLLLIGPGWADAEDASGNRRLEDSDDLHRTEISLAFQRGMQTVPVLIDGATAPAADILPVDLVPLTQRHAVTITPVGFDRQVEDLIESLGLTPAVGSEAAPSVQRPSKAPSDGRERAGRRRPNARILSGAAAMVLLVGLLAVLSLRSDGSGARTPEIGDTFQYQLGDLPIDTSASADVFDIDLFETPASTVDALHEDGRTVVCYLSAGTFEDVRPDADRFDDELLGSVLTDFTEEVWLDIRQIDQLMPIMEDRLDLCAEKGFAGVEFDNVDGYTNDSGFDLTAADQVAYLTALSDAARERDLSPGLKNALSLIPEVVDRFDWILIEQCFEFEECALARPFLDEDKAVFMVEYDADLEEACAQAPAGATVIGKDVDLGPSIESCP